MSTGIVTIIKKDKKYTLYKVTHYDMLGYNYKYNSVIKVPNYYSKRSLKKYIIVFINAYFKAFKAGKRKYIPLSLGNPDYDRVVFAY